MQFYNKLHTKPKSPGQTSLKAILFKDGLYCHRATMAARFSVVLKYINI